MPDIVEKPAARTLEVVADVTKQSVDSFEKASEGLKSRTSWETPAADAAATTETATTETAKPADGEKPVDSVAETPKFEGWVVDAEQKLHRPDGTFAEVAEIEAYNTAIEAENAAAAAATTVTDPAKPEEAVAEPILVKLKARDGSEVEIEVDDERTAETLRTNARDGLRGEEYRRKMATAEEFLAERRAFEAMIETNPEALILQHLPEEKQVSLAVALVAKLWDQIAPQLVNFDNDPTSRVAEAANSQIRIRDQQRDFEARTSRERYSAQLESAARALIPEHADDAQADQFLSDAAIDLGRAVQQKGGPISIDEVKTVLSRRLALYGFDKPAPTKEDPSNPPKRPIAKAVAKPAQAPTAQTVSATNGQAVKAKVSAQRVAAAVPPAGAGAASLRVPAVPPGSTIEQASQRLKQMKSWSTPTPA
jgi:hypothetical protein